MTHSLSIHPVLFITETHMQDERQWQTHTLLPTKTGVVPAVLLQAKDNGELPTAGESPLGYEITAQLSLRSKSVKP